MVLAMLQQRSFGAIPPDVMGRIGQEGLAEGIEQLMAELAQGMAPCSLIMKPGLFLMLTNFSLCKRSNWSKIISNHIVCCRAGSEQTCRGL